MKCEICGKNGDYFTELYNPDRKICENHWLCLEHQTQVYEVCTRSIRCIQYLNTPKVDLMPNNLGLVHHFCDCGSLMVATKKGNWKCPKCGKKISKQV